MTCEEPNRAAIPGRGGGELGIPDHFADRGQGGDMESVGMRVYPADNLDSC